MRNLLIQLDSSPRPSVFDRVVAYDGGADEVMSYSNITPDAVRELVHGAIFTRGPKDLHHTAIFVGGTDMAAGEELLAAVRKSFFGKFSVSAMLDSNGSNTTAVAAVGKIHRAADSMGGLKGRRVVVLGATGPVGLRAAGLLARRGADVVITSRKADRLLVAHDAIQKQFGVSVRQATFDPGHSSTAMDGVEILLSTGPAGACLVPRDSWWGRQGLRIAADVNAVPPLGIEGIEIGDDGVDRSGVVTFGAIGIGNLKMKIHKACIARLFERNDGVLDAESIDEIARELATAKT